MMSRYLTPAVYLAPSTPPDQKAFSIYPCPINLRLGSFALLHQMLQMIAHFDDMIEENQGKLSDLADKPLISQT